MKITYFIVSALAAIVAAHGPDGDDEPVAAGGHGHGAVAPKTPTPPAPVAPAVPVAPAAPAAGLPKAGTPKAGKAAPSAKDIQGLLAKYGKGKSAGPAAAAPPKAAAPASYPGGHGGHGH